MPQLTIEGDDAKLLSDVRIILQDKDTGKIPTNRGAVIQALKIIKAQGYQDNGADVRECSKEVSEGL